MYDVIDRYAIDVEGIEKILVYWEEEETKC